jgi:DNA-binding XRE family transcriptional regulator
MIEACYILNLWRLPAVYDEHWRNGQSPHNAVDVLVGQRLAMARKNEGLTLAAAADALQVSYDNYLAIEIGARRLSVIEMYKACAFFRVKVSWFF